MKLRRLTRNERKVWQAAATGTLVDLRVGDSELGSPEKWAEWGPERTIRAEVIADLLIGEGDAAVRGVRLQGARITGDLDLEATTLRCPLALLDCSFANALNLEEATAASVCLSGSHVPALQAKQLRTHGDLLLDKGSCVSEGVDLAGAHIGGVLSCRGGQFSNSDGVALRADRLTVDSNMYCDEGFAAIGEVRLLGAHIGGQLSCTRGQFSNPGGVALNADGLTVDQRMFCDEGFSAIGEVNLLGAHIGGQLVCTGGQFSNPDGDALTADGLAVDRGMFCDEGFSATGEVRLPGAHIGGQLDCTEGQFSNPDGVALNADGLSVDRGMFCGEGFTATGEVRLLGAHIGGQLSCTGGQFSNPDGVALNADGLSVDRGMFCREGFSASGEVRLPGAHIGGQLDCTGGQFSNPDGVALNADGLSVDQYMYCNGKFAATGDVRLLGAHIGGQLVCAGGQFSNPDGYALVADGLSVEEDMVCGEGFAASGEVRLLGVHIGGQLACTGGQFSNPNGSALNLERATVSGPLRMESAVLQGILNLTAAKTSSYRDDQASWPETLRLDGFVYDAIEGASAKERLAWLRHNESGYSPQIYDQLASVYRADGHDEDARRILIAKQRRRSAAGNLAGRIWGWLLYLTVGYGYRTWQALFWLIALSILGTWLFGSVYRSELTPANKPDVQPPFQPFLYTLDLLLPVVSLHVRDAWIAHGSAQVLSVVLTIMGWVLATAVVLSLTGLLKRD